MEDEDKLGEDQCNVCAIGGGSCDVSMKGERIEEVKGMKYLRALFNEEQSFLVCIS